MRRHFASVLFLLLLSRFVNAQPINEVSTGITFSKLYVKKSERDGGLGAGYRHYLSGLKWHPGIQCALKHRFSESKVTSIKAGVKLFYSKVKFNYKVVDWSEGYGNAMCPPMSSEAIYDGPVRMNILILQLPLSLDVLTHDRFHFELGGSVGINAMRNAERNYTASGNIHDENGCLIDVSGSGSFTWQMTSLYNDVFVEFGKGFILSNEHIASVDVEYARSLSSFEDYNPRFGIQKFSLNVSYNF